ncbi:MAG: hypothetical protein PHT31_01905 [Candidatus Omnitrophica bacterium]|nr:hypothetical protein [Candidatus Omnitrophota bacterium]
MSCKRKGRISGRLLGVKVKKIDNNARRLVVEEKRISGERVKCIKIIFSIDPHTLIIAKGNKSVCFSDIKTGNKIDIDFIKTQDKKILAKGIVILG